MPQLGNRRAVIRRNISGGTSAPRGGGSMGLGQARPAPNPGRLGQAQPAAKSGAPGAPAQPGVAPAKPLMPWDVAAANSEAGAQKTRDNSLTGLDAGWFATQQEYGLEGPWADYASNPYSRASLLQRSYDNAKRGTTNAAGHNLYAGSYINNQNSNTHGFNLGRDELQKSYAGANAAYISNRQRAQDEFNEAQNEAAWKRVNAGLESEPEAMPGKAGKGKPRRAQIKRNLRERRA